MRDSITKKIILNTVAVAVLTVFVSGGFLLRIFRNILTANRISTDVIDAVIKKSAGAFTLILILLVLVLILAVYSNLRRSIIVPLEKLRQGAELLGTGKMETRLEIKTQDEVGDLGVSFNKMASELQGLYENMDKKIKEKTEDVQKRNVDLEEVVWARTAELEKTKSNLKKQIEEQTGELREKLEQIESFNKMVVGRELKMMEIKRENEEMKNKLQALNGKI
jgi:nitrate/nitrite-specific signal transduction histidine kinase